jgi:small subunit ribosomal protein S8
MTDPISDMLTRIRNAITASKSSVLVPFSKMKYSIAQILEKNGYLVGVKKIKQGNFDYLLLDIVEESDKQQISKLERISKPGRRIYVKSSELRRVGGRGIAILSTPKGIMTGHEARNKKVGGELICKVY